MRRALLALLFLLLITTSSWSATYYVANNGSSGNNCQAATNQNTPKQSIRDAINNCARNPGDILLIRGGTYPEQLHTFAGTNWPSGRLAPPLPLRDFPAKRW
jgi:hypothetical protein